MPTRPNQHQLEDISRAKFQLILPRQWVLRDKNKDYGIDCEVELFDENNKASGLFFWAQLKATESQDQSIIKSVGLNIETLKYYKSLNVPIALFRYSHIEDCFYYKWINNVDLYYAEKDAKSYSIKFENNNKWDKGSEHSLEKHLQRNRLLYSRSFTFPISTYLDINESPLENKSVGILLTKIRQELANYSEFIIYSPSENDSLIQVSLNNNALLINASELYGCTFHSINKVPKQHVVKHLAQSILVGLAMIMARFGQIEYCGRIIFELKLEKRLMFDQQILFKLLPYLFESSYLEKTLNIITEIMDNKDISQELDILAQYGLLFITGTDNENKNKAIENFLLHRLKNASIAKDNLQIGISNYNLGNHYMGRSLHKLAIGHYITAKRNAPAYLKQKYFFSELAGCFFLIERFVMASKLYAKSLQLEYNSRIACLYADALMFEGKYAKAEEVFKKYLETEKKPIEEFVLKYNCLQSLFGNIKEQNRNGTKAKELADVTKFNSNEDSIKQLEESLDYDMLCNTSWFNLGVAFNTKQDVIKAMYSFLMAALIQHYDIEAWLNASILSINKEVQNEFSFLIIRVAYYFNKDQFLEALYSKIDLIDTNKEVAGMLIDIIEKILPKEKPKKDNVQLRILNNEIFENTIK